MKDNKVSVVTRQEELAHRAAHRSGLAESYKDDAFVAEVAKTPSIKKSLEAISRKGYANEPLHVKIDEVFAKSLRDNAAEELDITKKEARANRRALWQQTSSVGIDISEYKGISRAGDALIKYAERTKQASSRGDGRKGDGKAFTGRSVEGDPQPESISETRRERVGSSGRDALRRPGLPNPRQRTAVPEGRRSSPEKLKTALEKAGNNAADKTGDSTVGKAEPQKIDPQDVLFMRMSDLKDDRTLFNLADKYWQDLGKDVDKAKDIPTLNKALTSLSDGIYEKYVAKKAVISPSRARQQVRVLQSTNPREMTQAANRVGVVYQSDADNYSDADIAKLKAPAEEVLTNTPACDIRLVCDWIYS